MTVYHERREARLADALRLRNAEKKMSLGRLAAIAAAILAASASMWLLTAASIAAFFALVFLHDRTIRRRERAERGARFYQAGIERIEGT